ncbi:MAG: ATP-binding protein [Spirochaeta sp.]|nr:ATP-binding protein [Spirochaeta sp.]
MHYTLAEYLLDLVQNSIEADAGTIDLQIDEGDGAVRVVLQDDGCGMDEDTLARALDPFFTDGAKHPGRAVGLGLPFLRQMVESIDGSFDIASNRGVGTRIEFVLPTEHIDAPPVGSLSGVLQQLFCFTGEYELNVVRNRDGDGYELQRSALRDALGELDTAGSQSLLAEYISSQEESLEDNAGEARKWQR